MSDHHARPEGSKLPPSVKVNIRILVGVCTISVVADFFYHKHGNFAWESSFGFFSVYGFVACVILVIVAKYVLRPMVMRDEDYYDD